MASTISSNTFFLYADQSGYRQGSISVYSFGMEATLNPDNQVRAGEQITGMLTHGITNEAGTLEMAYHTWSFRAAVEPGGGMMTDYQQIGSWTPRSAVMGDMNNDGNLDLVLPESSADSHVMLNNGDGSFSTNQSFGRWIYPSDLALGDLDHDGDLDAFIVCSSYRNDQIWTNDGSGTLFDSGQRLGTNDHEAVALGDLDGDGDLDAFITTDSSEGNSVWFNDGNGTFTDSGQSLFGGTSRDVVIFDVDGDGDLDAFEADDSANFVWLNNGDGYFIDSGQRLGDNYSSSLSFGDINNDSFIDVFVGNGWDPDIIWLNDANGMFTNSPQTFASLYTSGTTLGDLDGDGDLDAVTCFGNSKADRIWLNDGTGVFSDSGERLGAETAFGVSAGDFNNDGRLDLYVIDGYGVPDHLWLNTVPEMDVQGINGITLDNEAPPSPITGTDFGNRVYPESLTHTILHHKFKQCRSLGLLAAPLTAPMPPTSPSAISQ